MKIIFANPPHIRTKNSSPQNNFKIDRFVFKPAYRKIKGFGRLFSFLNKNFGLGNGVRYGVRAGSRWPFTMPLPMNYTPYPFFMGYAAAYLKKNGFKVNILDAIAEDEYSYKKFLKKVAAQKADLVIIECSTPTIDIDIWFANKVAAFSRVALAGPHLNETTIKDIQKNNPLIKNYLIGEYILNSLKLASSLKEGVYPAEVVKDLDSIPFPFRNYKSATKYYDPTMKTPKPQLQIYGSKGCPFKCTYCSWPQNMYFGNVLLRNPQKIAQEIKENVKQFGFKSIFFDDDTFNLDNDRISRLCDELKKIDLPWTMMGRLDCSPDWLFDKMVDSGCVGMRFGVESFNLDVLKNVNKGLERTDFLSTIKYLSEKYPKLMIHLTMMKDLPGQTEEIHLNDLKILKKLGYDTKNSYRKYQLSCCVPFPGTKMYNDLIKEKGEAALNDYSLYDGNRNTIIKNFK